MPLIWAAFASPLFGQRLVDSGYRGSDYSFQSYRPSIVKRLDELPSAVIAHLKAHLKDRVGSNFYSKLKFDWGQRVDLDELYKIEPYWKTRKIAKYNLIFHFSKKTKGLKAFYCRIGLDESGGIVDEINLPKISEAPNKAKLITLRKAIEIANSNGFTPNAYAEFSYYNETDSFVWILHDSSRKVTEKLCRDKMIALIGQGPIGRMLIDANTGRVLGTNCYTIIV